MTESPLRAAMIPQDMRNGDFTNSPTLGTGGLKLDSIGANLENQLHPGVPCITDSNHVNPACFDPNAVAIMQKYWPLPNNPGGGFLNYINNGSDKVNQRDDTVRIDQYFSERFNLIEALAERLAAEVLADPRVARTVVRVAKPAALAGRNVETVLIEIERER